jgi:hypothetical protein
MNASRHIRDHTVALVLLLVVPLSGFQKLRLPKSTIKQLLDGQATQCRDSRGDPAPVVLDFISVPNAKKRKTVFDPFKLYFRLLLAGFRIAGYVCSCTLQSLWYVAHGRRELVGDAIGYLGRDITNAIADAFRRR